MLLVLLVAALVCPLAYIQFGQSGLMVVFLGLATVSASMWLAARCARYFAASGRATTGLLSSMGVRMILPLALVLGMVTIGRGHVAPKSVLYVVPLYLAMLVVDTLSSIRRIHPPRSEPVSESKPPEKTSRPQN
jgi:hypothetical protein